MTDQETIFVDQFGGNTAYSPYSRYNGHPVTVLERVLKGGRVFLLRVRAADGREFHVAPWELRERAG